MSLSTAQQYGRWRQQLWPFQKFELKKMLPLILIKFLVSLNYGILTSLKSTLVVNSKGAGAEVIPVLKGWFVLPCAILITLLYSKLSNVLKRTTLFYTFLGGFIFTVFICGFILYPNIDAYSPHASADFLTNFFHGKFSHWIAVYRNWIQSLVFIVAELWGSVVILLLFWGFANQITTIDEAKKSYTIYIAAGDLAAFLTGPIIHLITANLTPTNFTATIQILSLILVFIGLLIMGLYWWTNKYVLTDTRFNFPATQTTTANKKKKPTLFESMKHIAKSKYLLHIAVLVIGYGLAVNIVEVTYLANLKMLYPDHNSYLSFYANVFSIVGFTSLIISLFFCGGIMRSFGWHFTAQISPWVIGATGLGFFMLVLNQKSLAPIINQMGISPLLIVVLFGAFQNIASKVVKYSFFDPTKEMAYIPLDEDEKVKGKAAIDVVGSRLGKSGSSWVQVGLMDLMGTSSVLSITHFLIPIILATVCFWSYSVKQLGKLFEETKEPSSKPA
jgi:AAA family ATP:ADP antiporter